ncbi:lytic murein transglycosylase [Rhizobium rhizogenes]|uniref:Lytic murein transglycosylase n=1 Tax=Rhizobium rhizogenes TaxID=359 RepID=A0A546XNJ7_RHIRH|nr:lytic murein transglycosylase [Rhizobium rhizogenes]
MSGFTPLCPAGHLPHKEGDHARRGFALIKSLRMEQRKSRLPISLLVGEMPGRAEGGKAAHSGPTGF